MNMKLVRQGDVLLVPTKDLPRGASDITPRGDVVIKWGEVTGHAHRISVKKPGKVRLWDAGAERFLQVLETVAITHEEHSSITLAPGLYRVPEQVEWTDADEPRIVAD